MSRRLGVLLLLMLCLPAGAQNGPGWYPFQGDKLPWNLASHTPPLPLSQNVLEDGVWKITATLPAGSTSGSAWGSLGVWTPPWDASALQVDLTQAPVITYRMRWLKRDPGATWYFQPLVVLAEGETNTPYVYPGNLPQEATQGEWLTYTVNLNPAFLKIPRARLVGIHWHLNATAATGAGDKVFQAEVADLCVRPQTAAEQQTQSQDSFFRRVREGQRLPAPHITDRFWFGLWGNPYNFANGGPAISGRDMLTHQVQLMFCAGARWGWCATQVPPEQVADFYINKVGDWIDQACHPFDIAVIPNLSGIYQEGKTDPAVFAANLDRVLKAFGKDPLVIGWDGDEETHMDQVREYLTIQWAIEDRSPRQPMIAFLGELDALQKFIHTWAPSSYPIGSRKHDVRDVEQMMRDSWRYAPPTVWPILQGFADNAEGQVMPTAAETRVMAHEALAWGAGGIFWFHYGGVWPWRGPAGSQTLVDPFGNATEAWQEIAHLAPHVIRMGATTQGLRLDEAAGAVFNKAQDGSDPALNYYLLRPKAGSGPTVLLALNLDPAGAHPVRPDFGKLTGPGTGIFDFPEGQVTTLQGRRLAAPLTLEPGGMTGWLLGTAAQARTARQAADKALYESAVRLPKYDLTFARAWGVADKQASALLQQAERAARAGKYAEALPLQAQAEEIIQAALASNATYTAVTASLDQTRSLLGKLLEEVRQARLAGRVKDSDPIARGDAQAYELQQLGRHYADLRERWARGDTANLQPEAEKLRAEVQAFGGTLQAVLNPAG